MTRKRQLKINLLFMTARVMELSVVIDKAIAALDDCSPCGSEMCSPHCHIVREILEAGKVIGVEPGKIVT